MRFKRPTLLVPVVIALLFQVCLNTTQVTAQTGLPDLMRRITELAKAGRFPEATDLTRRQLVPAAERLAGKTHPITAVALSTLGDLLILQDQLTEAEPILKRVLSIRERAIGREHPDVAATLSSLANISIERGRYREADQYLRRALSIRQRILGAKHADTATTLLNIGRVRFFEANYSEAEKIFQQSLGVLRKSLGPDHSQVGVALNNLAEVYKEQGRFALAEAHLKQSLAIQEKQFGRDSIYAATMLNNIGELHVRQGKYAEAEELHRRVIQIKEKALGSNHRDVARSLNNLAITFTRRGHPAEAEGLLKRALIIQEKAVGADHPEVAATLNNLADAVSSQQRSNEAETFLQRSLAIREKQFGPQHASIAIALDNFAALLQGQDRFADAEPLARRSLIIREKAFTASHPLVARSLNQLAVILDELNRPKEAEPLLKRALGIYGKTLGDQHPDFAIALHNLASHQRDLGQSHEAYASFKRAGGILVSRRNGASNGFDEGSQAEIKRNADPFRGQIAAAYEVAAASGGQAVTDLSAEAFESSQWTLSERTSAALSHMAARIAAGGGQLGDIVRERQDLAEQAAATDRALITLMSQTALQRSPDAQAALHKHADAIVLRMKDIDGLLRTRFPEYAALTSTAPVSLKDAAGALRDREALLVYVPTKDAIYLWAVTRQTHRWVKIKLTAKVLSDHVAALRCGLDHVGAWSGAGAARCTQLLGQLKVADVEQSKPFDVARAHELYLALFGQVVDLIKDRHLFVVATGPLTGLPLQTLVASQPEAGQPNKADDYRQIDWLARRAAISVLPSVSSLTALRRNDQRSQATQAFIGFGNPLLSGSDSSDRRAWDKQNCGSADSSKPVAASRATALSAPTPLRNAGATVEALRRQPPLPETADELCTVAHTLGAPTSAVNLGENATEQRVKALSTNGELARARYLHFATHGLLASESEAVARTAAEPALLLTPPQRASANDDGLLTASEVAQLKLNADWVILSACNTAAGDKVDAEALSGLARAFFFAGSRALLVSHWYVDSDAAVGLVTRAFTELHARHDIGRAEAVRRAMLTLFNDGGPMAHPAKWAPFVVVGEGGT